MITEWMEKVAHRPSEDVVYHTNPDCHRVHDQHIPKPKTWLENDDVCNIRECSTCDPETVDFTGAKAGSHLEAVLRHAEES